MTQTADTGKEYLELEAPTLDLEMVRLGGSTLDAEEALQKPSTAAGPDLHDPGTEIPE